MPSRHMPPAAPTSIHITPSPLATAARPLAQAVRLALTVSLLTGPGWSAVVSAQAEVPALAEMSVDTVRQYDIPPGALSSALTRFASEAGIFLIGATELTRDKHSVGVQGQMDVPTALDYLLSDTGLVWSFTGSNTVTIARGREAIDMPVSEAAALELDTVVVRGQSGGLSRNTLDKMPNKSNSIEGALGLFSEVQTATNAQRSLQGGEIKPPQISISGGKPYESRYVIDGLGNNNYVAPPRVGDGNFSDLNNPAYLDNPGHLSQPLGMTQSYNLSPELLDNIELHDSRVPVKHSGFTGGVVSADTRKPRTDRVSGKLHWGHARSGWDKQFFDKAGLKGESFGESYNAARQPEYTRNSAGVMLNIPLTERFGSIISYDTTRSEIPLNYVQNYSDALTPANSKKKDQERTSETLFLSVGGQTLSGLDVSLTGVYYNYEGNYFFQNAINSEVDQNQKTYDLALNLSQDFALGKASARFKYGNMKSNREAETNTRYMWVSYADQSWGDPDWQTNTIVNPVTGAISGRVSMDGNHLGADMEFEQRTFQTGLDFEFNELEWGATRHRFAMGANAELIRGEASNSGSTVYQGGLNRVGVNGPINPGQDGVAYNWDPANGLYDQYFLMKIITPAYERDASINTYSLWLDDTISFHDFTLRPGIRVDYDDQFKNTNIAPRISGDWNILGKNLAVLHAGAARYYGGPNLYHELYRSDGLGTQLRLGGLTPPANGELGPWSGNVSKGHDYQASDMKTPYSDEFSLGMDLKLAGGFALDYNFVYREGKDGIMTRSFRNAENALSYEATNDGETTYTGHTIALTNTYLRNHYFRLSTTVADNESNYLDYMTLSSSILDGNLDRSRVIYQGSLIETNELDMSQFNRPLQIVGFWHARLTDRIDLGTTVTWTDRSPVLVSTGRVPLDDGYEVHSYTRDELPSRFTIDTSLGVDLLRHNNQVLRANLDIYNLLNSKDQNGIGNAGTATNPIFFDYYAPGRSFMARLEYSF